MSLIAATETRRVSDRRSTLRTEYRYSMHAGGYRVVVLLNILSKYISTYAEDQME